MELMFCYRQALRNQRKFWTKFVIDGLYQKLLRGFTFASKLSTIGSNRILSISWKMVKIWKWWKFSWKTLSRCITVILNVLQYGGDLMKCQKDKSRVCSLAVFRVGKIFFQVNHLLENGGKAQAEMTERCRE